MSRRLFEDWGAALSDREFGQALALLGVVGDVIPDRHGLTRDAARSLVDRRVQRAGDDPLAWDLASIGGLGGLRRRLADEDPLTLAAAWNDSSAPYRPLEIHPTPGLPNRWLAQILQGALAQGLPHFPLPEPQGRPRWNWPLRIGFAVDDGRLRDRIYGPAGLSGSVAPLTESEVGPTRCDILLIEADRVRGLREIAAMGLPEAALVLVFNDGARPEDPLRARAIAERTNAAGVVLLEAGPALETEWLERFLRELSHLVPILPSLRHVGGIAALLAAPRLLDGRPLVEATAALEATLGMTAAMPPADEMAVAAMPPTTMVELDMPAGEMTVPIIREHFARRSMTFRNETGGASHVAAVTRSATPALEALEEGQAEDRYIRADVDVPGAGGRNRLRRGFLAGARHRIAVSIGPPDGDHIVGGTAVPGLAAAIGHQLTIVLSEPALLRKPLVGKVELPPFGPTRDLVFDLPVRRSSAAVEARISVLHRGRILQTALLRGAVYGQAELDRREALEPAERPADDPGIEIVPEANLRPGFAGLDDRTRFHSAIVLNHAANGSAGGTAMGRKKTVSFNLDIVKEAVAALSTRLEAAERDQAFDRKLDSAKSLTHLRLLALEGVKLYLRIGKAIESTHGARLERLQVLSANPNTMLPVELIYDLPPPNKQPKLCANAAEALRTGRCDPKQFHVEDALGQLDVVCPSGFWGVSKIIERQATRKATADAGFVVRSMPTRRQKRLGPLTPVLFAASDHVNDVDPKELARVSKALEKLTDNKVTRVDTWLDWAGQVKSKEPPLLLLLSHTETNVPEGPSLEIARKGGTEIQAVANITKNFVNLNPDRPGPVVMLLGCTTAVPLDTFQTFTVQFADVGASLVIGTIAPVLGRHAGRTAEGLIEALKGVQADAGGRRGIPVGEALRDVRRTLLAKGILMSMSLAAYGDADWQLPVEA